jgi:hypothetical protein
MFKKFPGLETRRMREYKMFKSWIKKKY